MELTTPNSAETNGASAVPRPTWKLILLLFVLCAIHAALAVDVVLKKSPTVDEIGHLPAALSYVDTGIFKLYRYSPPLARLVAAWAAKTAHPDMKAMYGSEEWRADRGAQWYYAFELQLRYAQGNEADWKAFLDLFTRGRLAIVAWSTLTIPVLFLWGMRWFGPWAGLLSAALWTFCPNIIAHAGMITTDLAFTSASIIAAFFFSLWLDRPTVLRALAAGITLGIAHLTKFSSLTLLMVLFLWYLFDPLWSKPDSQGRWRASLARMLPWRFVTTKRGAQFLLLNALSMLVIDCGYNFSGVGLPLGNFEFVSTGLTRPRLLNDPPPLLGQHSLMNALLSSRCNIFTGTLLGVIPCPLPYDYVTGFDEQKLESEGGYPAYLNGQLQHKGWKYYYIVALALKVPLSTWLLAFLATLQFRRPESGRSLIPLWIAFLVPLAMMSLLTDICIGVRYVLSIFPFAFLIAGSLVAQGRGKIWRIIALLAMAYNVIAIARIHPHELSYFNEIVGPRNGRFYLIDSNLDWGQDLRGLARWIEKHPEWKDVRLAYMGNVQPEFEGIRPYQLAERDLAFVPQTHRLRKELLYGETISGPLPGKYAVSVNYECGMPFRSPTPLHLRDQFFAESSGAMMARTFMIQNDTNVYSYFRKFQPRIEPEIGYSILLYDISLEEANRVRVELGLAPVTEDEVKKVRAP